MRISIFLIGSLLCLSVFTSCKKEDTPTSPALKAQTSRTVLTYMFQDSNLWEALTANINDMERGWDPATDGTLLVYVDASTAITQFDGKPVLLEITHDTTNLIVSRVVKVYPDLDAAKTEVFRQAQQDAIEMYPADSYGLIFSGHGNGFMVNATANHYTKSVSGSDRWSADGLDIDVIANNTLTHYDFIIFDACTMGETSTLYQLRKVTDFVVASVELTPGSGFGYRSDIQALFTQPKADLYSFANGSTAYYRYTEEGKDEVATNYFTLGIYRMSAMEKLAEATKTAFDKLAFNYPDLETEILKIIGTTGFMNSLYYPRDKKLIPTTWYYDLGLIPMLLNAKGEAELAHELRSAINEVVIQKHFVLPQPFTTDNEKYSDSTANLSFYIPSVEPTLKLQDDAFYTRFEWSTASGFTSERE